MKYLTGIIILMVSYSLSAETLVIEEKTTVNNGQNVTIKKSTYSKTNAYISDSGQPLDMIFDFSKNIVTVLDKNKKTAMDMTMQVYNNMAKSGMGQLGQLFDSDVEIMKNNQQMIINGFDCRQITVSIKKLGLKIEYWAASPKGITLDSYYNFSLMNGQYGGMKKIAVFFKTNKYYPVVTKWYRYGLESAVVRTDLIDIRVENDGSFTVPQGYKKLQ